MSYFKVIKDYAIKALRPKVVPEGLFDLVHYSKSYGGIKFNYSKGDGGLIIAESDNYRYGVIITSRKSDDELDKNIKDAILTAFEIPSSYASKANIVRVDEHKAEYVVA